MEREVNLAGIKFADIEFLSKLGSGGYATVYMGSQTFYPGQEPRRVAIKAFLASSGDRDDSNTKFENWKRDIKPLNELASHSSIIEYHTTHIQEIIVGADGHATTSLSHPTSDEESYTGFFLVMEFADGGSLGRTEYRDQIIRGREPSFFLDHFVNICHGLKEAHAKSIFHRDIKPENLLWFAKANRVKIGDFGIAQFADSVSDPESYMVGSLAYMPPEAFQFGQTASAQRDIYSLGCTFYELLTGRKPFTIDGSISDRIAARDAWYDQHRKAPRPDGFQYAKELVSLEFNGLLKQMMDVNPGGRPSLTTIIAALEDRKKALAIDVTEPTSKDMEAKPPLRTPIMRQLRLVNPKVRELLNERLFFMFLNIKGYNDYKINKLLYYLNQYFGVAFSLFEVYGRYDFVVRVWANKDEQAVKKFCTHLLQAVLNNDVECLVVLPCDGVNYIESKSRSHKALPLDAPVSEWLIKIYEAQVSNDSNAIKHLENVGVYVRTVPPLDPEKMVKSFTLVQARSTNEHARDGEYAQLLLKIRDLGDKAKDFRFALYKASLVPFGIGNRPPCDYLVSYVTKKFHEVSLVPELLLEDFPQHNYETITLLASGRYFVFSDGVLLGK